MGLLNSEINHDVILKDLGNCCLTEESCVVCDKAECLVGYAKECITGCLKNDITFVDKGFDQIPVFDTKFFRTEDFIAGIAHILQQCKSCSEEHYKDCIINILRSSYEVGLFGEPQSYKGSAFRYLNQIHESHPELANQIIEIFHSKNA